MQQDCPININVIEEDITVNLASEDCITLLINDIEPINVSLGNNDIKVNLIDDADIDVSGIGVVGPQGPVGPIGPQGPQGIQGYPGATQPNSAEADENIKAGQAVYIKGNGHIALCKANSPFTSECDGLAIADCNTGFACSYLSIGILTLTDWTIVIGSVFFSVGQDYYLDPFNAGSLTNIAPTLRGQYVTKVGTAISSETIEIIIDRKILL